MLEVQKRDNENSEGLIRRFTRVVQQSGVLLQAKKVRYHEKKKSKMKVREEAQRRGELQAERDRLIKLGEIDEFSYPQKKKRW
ncbi:MAG: 30S ribosomal protein S21 [Candidatus Andersenbacteria bacterium RIFCSPHIGHO2_12_FULL_45_11b]|uniref:Small ribosomal subunit protein bS21 n=1 Tax=Candidatus Andersenbacteria bacterium RIFCSPHIGHO2_12_FULL_45_11b TaxID=1797282 RepID=A0A1G1X7R1_9BACT|nr:MAG: 30S ribosomal protein S21 [Candidatus Andersenbacteria bacterium RIFCSPHIGHO2_12_FULL_45_11b]